MTTADGTAVFVAVSMVAVGLSHLFQARAWGELFVPMRRWPAAGLAVGAATLPIGLFIALGHNVWTPGPAVLVTAFGWLIVAKAVVYLLHPAAFQRACPETVDGFVPACRRAGAAMLAVGAVVTAHLVATAG
jgi:uncharacterized protein YjeT (DUF2065 family)